jgi:folate-binding Fe-S cluster repair protein YgfZ
MEVPERKTRGLRIFPEISKEKRMRKELRKTPLNRWISGKDAAPFLLHVLTNNVLALDPGMAQYTLIPNEKGGALDDTYLYRTDEDDSGPGSYLLVVNAANREKDWDWLMEQRKRFPGLIIEDKTDEIGMMAFSDQNDPGEDSETSRPLEKSAKNQPDGRNLGDGLKDGLYRRTYRF